MQFKGNLSDPWKCAHEKRKHKSTIQGNCWINFCFSLFKAHFLYFLCFSAKRAEKPEKYKSFLVFVGKLRDFPRKANRNSMGGWKTKGFFILLRKSISDFQRNWVFKEKPISRRNYRNPRGFLKVIPLKGSSPAGPSRLAQAREMTVRLMIRKVPEWQYFSPSINRGLIYRQGRLLSYLAWFGPNIGNYRLSTKDFVEKINNFLL